jgi:hypothetical protein
VELDLQADQQPLASGEDPPEAGNDLVAIDGYLGAGNNGSWRLYRDRSLSYWLEIDEEDIRDAETVTSDAAPRPVTVVWLEGGATLTAKTSPPDTGLSDFLRSPFTAEDLVKVEGQSWGAHPNMSRIHHNSKCY